MKSQDSISSELNDYRMQLAALKTGQRYNFTSLKSNRSASPNSYDFAWTITGTGRSNRMLTLTHANEGYSLNEVELYIRVGNTNVMASPTSEGVWVVGSYVLQLTAYRKRPSLTSQRIELYMDCNYAVTFPFTAYLKVFSVGTDDVTFSVST